MFTVVLLANLLTTRVQSFPTYKVVQKIPIGGDGGWDCIEIDHASHRLYISRGSHVMVLDVNSGKIVGDIPNTNGVHDIALVTKLNKGYISDGRDNAVMVIDLKTLKEVGQIKVGERPDGMLYDRASNRVFSFNGGSSDATAIDPKTDTVAGTVKLDGKPEFAQPDGHGKVYVNIEDKSMIDEFDAKTLSVIGSWPLTPGDGPSGLAFDSKHGLLFSACDGMMTVSDIKTRKVIGTPAIGNGADGAGFDPGTMCAISPNGRDGTITIISEKDGAFTPIQTLPTQRGARTMALDPKDHKIYLIAADYEPVPADAPANTRPKMVAGSAVILLVAPQ